MINLDPSEEYVIIPVKVIEKIVRYALSVCQDRCPSERDPETCIYLVSLCKILGLGQPPCIIDYGNYEAKTFNKVIKDLERKYKIKIQEFISTIKKRGPRNLEENIDYMEAEFAIGILKALSNKQHVYIAKGSDIKIEKAVKI